MVIDQRANLCVCSHAFIYFADDDDHHHHHQIRSDHKVTSVEFVEHVVVVFLLLLYFSHDHDGILLNYEKT